jgi:hypothetical protein
MSRAVSSPNIVTAIQVVIGEGELRAKPAGRLLHEARACVWVHSRSYPGRRVVFLERCLGPFMARYRRAERIVASDPLVPRAKAKRGAWVRRGPADHAAFGPAENGGEMVRASVALTDGGAPFDAQMAAHEGV